MVDVTIERDTDGRIQAITLQGGEESSEGLAASILVDASLLTLRDYLHLAPEVKVEGAGRQLLVDRTDLFLDREIDAVFEVVVRGLRALKRRRPESMELRDASMDVKV